MSSVLSNRRRRTSLRFQEEGEHGPALTKNPLPAEGSERPKGKGNVVGRTRARRVCKYSEAEWQEIADSIKKVRWHQLSDGERKLLGRGGE